MNDWRAIGGWPGYEISSIGEVRGPHGPMSWWICKDGYAHVSLRRFPRERKHQQVHRLVVSAFIGTIPNGMTVNHKNGQKLDNAVGNLEIATRRENTRHAYATGLMNPPKGDAHHTRRHPERFRLKKNAKLTAGQVAAIRNEYSPSVMGYRRLAKKYGVSPSMICSIVRGRAWVLHGPGHKPNDPIAKREAEGETEAE